MISYHYTWDNGKQEKQGNLKKTHYNCEHPSPTICSHTSTTLNPLISSQNKRTSLHTKQNQNLYSSNELAFFLGPNILDLLVTSPTNLLDLLPTNLSHPHYPPSIRESPLSSQPSKSLRNLASIQPPKFTCKEKEKKQHKNSKDAYPYSFSNCSINCHLFWHFLRFSLVKENHPC
jgi:hypothetical protein